MAISVILFGLIFGPIITSFNLTNRARTQIESQTAARNIVGLLTKELSDAVYVYDNASTPVNIWTVNSDGSPFVSPTLFTMLEYVKPARQGDQAPGTLSIDPTTGLPIYTGSSANGATSGFSLPLAPGRALVRVFIGLHNNAAAANNGTTYPTVIQDQYGNTPDGVPQHVYHNLWEDPPGRAYYPNNPPDNRYVLYRAEVTVYVQNTGPYTTGGGATNAYVSDMRLFHTVKSDGVTAGGKFDTPVLHDPNFFYDATAAGDPSDNPGSSKWAMPGASPTGPGGTFTIADNWKAVSSVVVAPEKIDCIGFARNANTNAIAFTSGTTPQHPTPNPLITFSPTYMQNDSGVAAALESTANESPSPAPTAYTTQYTFWSEPFRVYVYRNPAVYLPSSLWSQNLPSGQSPSTDPLSLNPLTFYEFLFLQNGPTGSGNPILKTNSDGSPAWKIVFEQAPPGTTPTQSDPTVATDDVGPQPDINGFWQLNTQTGTPPQIAFTVDAQRGAINFAFPQWAVTWTTVNNVRMPLPCYYSPVDVNSALTGAYGRRFIDLRKPLSAALYGATGNQQPLNAAETLNANLLTPLGWLQPSNAGATNPISNFVPTVRIVPGSERVFGPDMRPGPHYGYRTQFTRVASNAGVVGPNQYKISYEDNPNAAPADANDPGGNANDPRVHVGYVEFDSQFDGDSTSTTSIQAGTFPPHSLPICKWDPTIGDVNANLPSDPIEVSYQFQMNRPNDVVKVDYLTRGLMNVAVQARLYEPSTGTPQVTVVTEKIRVRNLQH
jgi:hypothetical protein